MKRHKSLVTCGLFGFILIIASFLRIYRLHEVPPGVNRDEASIGYTAYSLIQTGKDEYGRQFPLSFESFGDWKLPVYIYTTVPFVKVFGMSELAVRLPSTIAGITAVGLTYFLVQTLFSSQTLPLLSMLIIAISPWHVHLSRTESESNVAVLFVIVALIFFFKALKKRPIFFIGSAFFFALTYFTYAGNHITTTLLVIGLFFINRAKIPKNKYIVISATIFIVMAGFILLQTLAQADKTKLSGISIFGDPAIIHEQIEIPRNQHNNPQSILARVVHNRIVYALEIISQHYLKSFSPEFLFITGGTNHAHNIQNFGNLYLVDSLFFYFGAVLLFMRRKEKNWKFLLYWLLISPIAASITKDAPHTNRMFAIYPIPPILIALGIQKMLELFKNYKVQMFVGLIIVSAYLGNILVYLDRYYVHFPKTEVQYWGLPYKDLYKRLSQPDLVNKQVIITHPEYSPYIFLLFYSKFNPHTYQKSAVRYPPTNDAFIHVLSYDRFTFRDIDWGKDIYLPNTILVDFSETAPKLSPAEHVSIFTLVKTF